MLNAPSVRPLSCALGRRIHGQVAGSVCSQPWSPARVAARRKVAGFAVNTGDFISLHTRPISTHPSRSASVTGTPTAAVHPLQSSYPDAPRHIPDVVADDLPIISLDAHQVAIGWDTRTWSRFHNIWLRDHCRCPKCFHPTTKQRLFNTFEIPKDIAPLHVESRPTGLEVTWPSKEPHISLYPWSWLQRNSYDPPLSKPKSTSTEKILWGSKIQQAPPTVAYEDVMASDDRGLYKWLTNVSKFGFSFVSGVPATPEATEELSTRIGFIRETQYGKFWDFTSDLSIGDTAYTTLALGAHTDNTYFTDPSGLQLFHLLSHTNGSGGATLLVDGFYAASIMKELHPKAYDLLSRVRVPAHSAGEPGAFYTPFPESGYPVLGHEGIESAGGGESGGEGGEGGDRGELVQVRWNNDDRSVMKGLKADVVEDWYEAIRLWNKCLTSPDSEYWVQLQPGTAVLLNNHRVLHGRSAFDGKRRMCGAYIGVDEYRSKLAVLRERFENSSAANTTNAKPNFSADSSSTVVGATAAGEEPVVEADAGRSVWSDAL